MNIERTLTLSGPVELGGAGAASVPPTFVKYKGSQVSAVPIIAIPGIVRIENSTK